MTMKTKASHRRRLFKAKSCFLSEHSGVLLGGTGKVASLLRLLFRSICFPSAEEAFPSLKGREGHGRRGITAESVAARNPSRGLESRRLHAARRAGFYWPFSITPVTLDWVCRSISFSWKGQSRLWGQARLKWNTDGMRPNITPGCLNANQDWIMNDL